VPALQQALEAGFADAARLPHAHRRANRDAFDWPAPTLDAAP
jgi:hypothetical protein